MSIMSSSSLPRSSPAAFRTLSPASVLAARTRRYFLSGSVCLIFSCCIELLLYPSGALHLSGLSSFACAAVRFVTLDRPGRRSAGVYTSINRHGAARGAENYRREEQYLHDGSRRQAFTMAAFFTKSGSNSTPRPWPVGTGITPFLISKFGVYQDSFLAPARETYSIQGPIFGVVAGEFRKVFHGGGA